MTHRIIIGIFFLLICFSCQRENTAAELPCSDDIMCTRQFVSIQIKVLDQHGEPVLLDSYISKNLTTGEEFNLMQDDANLSGEGTGTYTLITDAQIKQLKRAGSSIEFTGSKNGQVVVKQTYQLGHDCCHVQKISGPDKLEITL